MMLLLSLLLTGCTMFEKIENDFIPWQIRLNDSYYFDEEARRGLMKNDSNQYLWDDETRQIIEKYAITFQTPGEIFPDVKINVSDDLFVKSLSKECNLIFELETQGNKRIGKTKYVDNKGTILKELLSYEYLDNNGKPYLAEFYDETNQLASQYELKDGKLYIKIVDQPYIRISELNNGKVYNYIHVEEEMINYNVGDTELQSIEIYENGKLAKMDITNAFTVDHSEDIVCTITYDYDEAGSYTKYEEYGQAYGGSKLFSECKGNFCKGNYTELYDNNGAQIYDALLNPKWEFFDIDNNCYVMYSISNYDEFSIFELTECELLYPNYYYFAYDMFNELIKDYDEQYYKENDFKKLSFYPNYDVINFQYSKQFSNN